MQRKVFILCIFIHVCVIDICQFVSLTYMCDVGNGCCRWVNCLDPSLNKAEWTEEEDLKLEEAIAKHGYCWSKVAAYVQRRTDNQCWRYVSLTVKVSLESRFFCFECISSV